MGIILLEAMASGTPVVASNISGYATVVNHGVDGLLTTPRNSAELSWAVRYLLEHESLRQQFTQAGLQKLANMPGHMLHNALWTITVNC